MTDWFADFKTYNEEKQARLRTEVEYMSPQQELASKLTREMKQNGRTPDDSVAKEKERKRRVVAELQKTIPPGEYCAVWPRRFEW